MKLVLAILSLFSLAQAQEKLIVKETLVHAIASFETVDYFSTFSREGVFLWEVPFSSKIQSIEDGGDQIFVLSQTRNEGAFFLSCMDKETGKIIWEKGIFAPQQISFNPTTEELTPVGE